MPSLQIISEIHSPSRGTYFPVVPGTCLVNHKGSVAGQVIDRQIDRWIDRSTASRFRNIAILVRVGEPVAIKTI